MITVFAPAGIGEIHAGDDLPSMIMTAAAADLNGPLADGDILVVTSKIISKAEGRRRPADERMDAIVAESTRTVARRGPMRIVRTRHGLTIAAAGVDNSNVEPESILLLPLDPDASARDIRGALRDRFQVAVGVIISDTAGRAWRMGQTDHAIGLHGLRAMLRYQGMTDGYGNPLQVTAMAVADELAGAADLVKAKLGGRPVAVVRGLGPLVTDTTEDSGQAVYGAAELLRPVEEDLFRLGTRESVIEAIATVTGRRDEVEQLFALPVDELVDTLADGLDPSAARLVRAMVEHACRTSPSAPGGV